MKYLTCSLGATITLLVALMLSGCDPQIQTVAPATPTLVPTSTNLPAPTRNPAPGFAEAGVESNADWRPYIQEFEGVEMALVPAGCFMMGSSEDEFDVAFQQCKEELGKGECGRNWFVSEAPQHKVCFDKPFWIDVYEVTNGQYGGPSEDCMEWSSEDDQPRICTDWFDSIAHCESRDARLPTEAEWEYAARGPDGLKYPWGNGFECSRGNYNDETSYYPIVEVREECDGFFQTAPVGSFQDGISWVGAYDLSGNVWEWMSDWYGADYYADSPANNPQGPESGENRVMRGGSWQNSVVYGLRAVYRAMLAPDDWSRSAGFRCARPYNP